MTRESERQAIIRAAAEQGISPAHALAIASRESNFDPTARSSKTIHGMYQMTGSLRRQYGVGDSNDPYEQAKGWGAFFKDNKGEMARTLGRDPTDTEGYLGHYWGSTRAARMLKMDPQTPVDQVFTPYERSINPNFDKAGTVGRLSSSVMADIDKRAAKYGGSDLPDLAEFGEPVSPPTAAGTSHGSGREPSAPDLSSFGTRISEGPDPPKMASLEQPPTGSDPNPAIEERKFDVPEPQQPAPPAPTGPDLSTFGTPAA